MGTCPIINIKKNMHHSFKGINITGDYINFHLESLPILIKQTFLQGVFQNYQVAFGHLKVGLN